MHFPGNAVGAIANPLASGVSTYHDEPKLVGPEYLKPLLEHALDVVPEYAVADTPIFLLATAGMRLLTDIQRNALLDEICSYARENTKFLLPDCGLHIQVIPGETEGLYGWIAANYLLGGFDSPDSHSHGKGHHTYGFLDMGGASAQIAFAPNATEAERHANDLTLLRMRKVNGQPEEYKVFVTTWLGFGVHEARRRYVEALLEASGTHDARELPDPCLPVGLSISTQGDVLLPDSSPAKQEDPYLIGTGRFDECLRQTWPLLGKEVPCADPPCLLNGVHVPAIDFDVNHFIGVSEYWHTTHEVFEMGHKDKAYDFNTYQKRVKDFCSQDWEEITDGIQDKQWGKKVDEATAVEVCFKASWLINVLHDGIGIPRVTLENTNTTWHNGTKEVIKGKQKGYLDSFQAVNKIDDTEVSWTLGKMVLYAASQTPPEDLRDGTTELPVGFGTNTVSGVPSNFQLAGSKYRPLSDSPDDIDPYDDLESEAWHDTLFNADSPRRIPGFVFFVLILCVAAYLLCGRDRRARYFRNRSTIFSLFNNRSPSSRKRGSGYLVSKIPFLNSSSRDNSGSYDRVSLGDAELGQFELEDVASDRSDSSEESRNGRASGWATPRIKEPRFEPTTPGGGGRGYFENAATLPGNAPGLSAANAMDRSGLVVRTESRERLPTTPGFGGRFSRSGSPTRAGRSPLMDPLAED